MGVLAGRARRGLSVQQMRDLLAQVRIFVGVLLQARLDAFEFLQRASQIKFWRGLRLSRRWRSLNGLLCLFDRCNGNRRRIGVWGVWCAFWRRRWIRHRRNIRRRRFSNRRSLDGRRRRDRRGQTLFRHGRFLSAFFPRRISGNQLLDNRLQGRKLLRWRWYRYRRRRRHWRRCRHWLGFSVRQVEQRRAAHF